MNHEVKKCSKCEAPIIFLPTKNGKVMPVVAATVEPEDDLFDHKKHTSHFSDCPNADIFRKKK